MSAFAGKVAVVTDADSGIGLAAAKAFAWQGAQVVVTGRQRAAVRAAVAEIGCAAIGIQGDIADLAHHARVADLVRDRFGGLDVYMANAGVSTIAPSAEAPPDAHDARFAANVRGVLFGVQQMLPLVRDGGSIIVTGTIARGGPPDAPRPASSPNHPSPVQSHLWE
jgi:NAD(P)-dependent dehydrogenase (short-subunit alcohol dehydrogenase family)